MTAVWRSSGTLCRSMLLLLGLLAISCQKGPRFQKVYPVKGRVLIAEKAAAGVTVLFTRLDDSTATDPRELYVKPRGKTDTEGWFFLTTYNKDDGAPAGSYAVTLFWLPEGYAGPIEAGNKLLAHYMDPETSGIKAEVGPNSKELKPFVLQE